MSLSFLFFFFPSHFKEEFLRCTYGASVRNAHCLGPPPPSTGSHVPSLGGYQPTLARCLQCGRSLASRMAALSHPPQERWLIPFHKRRNNHRKGYIICEGAGGPSPVSPELTLSPGKQTRVSDSGALGEQGGKGVLCPPRSADPGGQCGPKRPGAPLPILGSHEEPRPASNTRGSIPFPKNQHQGGQE